MRALSQSAHRVDPGWGIAARGNGGTRIARSWLDNLTMLDETMQELRFANRRSAGSVLAERLRAYAGRDDVLVLGLPRGGVPVAYRSLAPARESKVDHDRPRNRCRPPSGTAA